MGGICFVCEAKPSACGVLVGRNEGKGLLIRSKP